MMKQLYITLIVSVAMGLNGCGGGGSGGSSSDEGAPPSGATVELKPDLIYTVNPGDRLVKNASDTVVEIQHTRGHTESSVKLIAGSATIIRK